VAHACNPSDSGGRDQEDGGSKQIVGETLSRKNPSRKRVAQSVNSEFKPQYYKEKRN
jgi:hypothetical protein